MKKVYESNLGPRRKERPVVRWKDRVKEYMRKRGADRDGGSVLIEKWRLLLWLRGTFLEGMRCQKLYIDRLMMLLEIL